MVYTYEGTLNTTGGSLRPDKSYWYMIDYKYIGNRCIYKSTKQLPGTITVKAVDGTRAKVSKGDIGNFGFDEQELYRSNRVPAEKNSQMTEFSQHQG